MTTLKIEIPIDDGRPAQTLSWIIRGFFGGIAEAYHRDAPRREEAYRISINMVDSAVVSGQISEEESKEIYYDIRSIYHHVYPNTVDRTR